MNTLLNITIDAARLTHIFSLAFYGFIVAMALTPLYTTVAYKKEWWKKMRKDSWSGGKATVYAKLHAAKHKRNIPTMAGLIFVLATLLVTLVGNLSREQTWLPLAAMVGAGIVGLIDDFINISSQGKGIAGMRSLIKFILHTLVAVVGGWWFYSKLGIDTISIPLDGTITLGIFMIPLFVLVVIATANAVNMSDGLDGLAGGLLTTSFAVYSIIAFLEGQFGLAGFCMTIVGTLLSYTWFNIHPARFFMGDVGSFALGTALGVVAMLTDTVLLLPLIGFVYVAEAGSVIINRTSKKLRGGKKVFLSSPIHHHFEAIGWPETKVTMRFWIVGQVCAVMGLVVYLISNHG